MSRLTYPDVGATRNDRLPAGFHHVRHRVRLPDDAFAAAAEAVLTWRLHRRAGFRMETRAPRAATGVDVTVAPGLGPLRLRAPCRVVWAEDGPSRAGFGYGTLPGHPECGEEAFLVERDVAGVVWFTVRAFSVPATWALRVAGPLGRSAQRRYAWWLGRTLRRLVSR